MNSIQTFVPQRNTIGQFASIKLAALKKIARRVGKIIVVSYLVLTFLGTVWAIHLTKDTYNFKCSVNSQVVGYFNKKSTCDELYQNWVSQSRVAEDHNLINNPDLR